MGEVAQIFLSHSQEDAFEANLFQWCIERLLSDLNVRVWNYQRDQLGNQKNVGNSLREQVQTSRAMIFLVSQFTLESGATQWMELAYADAYAIPTFILLHHITYDDLKNSSKGVPPLILSSECKPAIRWQDLENELRSYCIEDRLQPGPHDIL